MPTERQAPTDLEDAYREHRLALLRLAYLMCGSHETSEDVVQTVFASAHERWDEIENPLAYLKRAVVNLVKDGQRRRFRRQAARPAHHPPAVVLPPDVDETWQQLARLPATQRAVLVLHYYEDLPLTEVAALLDRPAATVRSDHRRALDRLRKEPMTTQLTDVEVEQRLRRTFDTMADTVTEARSPADRTAAQRKRRRRRIGLGAAALALPLAAAAGTFARTGPEYVDTIPESSIIVRGEVDGSSYLLVESRRTDRCGQPVTGVELVEEDENILGSEWNTTGTEYGEYGDDDCSFTERYLADPSLFVDGGAQVGDSVVWTWGVHPDVTAVRITSGDFHEDLEVHRVDGAGYALFVIPKDLDGYDAELLVGDEVVPGSFEAHQVPRF